MTGRQAGWLVYRLEWCRMGFHEPGRGEEDCGLTGHPLLGYYSLAMGARAVLDAFLRVVVVE
jgi:hypothetical protein